MPINYEKYPPNWKTEIRPRILTRDGYRCKFCGIAHNSIAVGEKSRRMYRVVLTIAHLDHDPENWEVSDERLVALCQRCHLKYDRQMKLQ